MVTEKDFLEFSYERVQQEHVELSQAWALLDAKSQATAATAGVFIAAAFAFVQNSADVLSCPEKGILALTVTFLVVSIACSIGSMMIRTVAIPPTGSYTWDEINKIFKGQSLHESLDGRYIGLLSDAVKLWVASNVDFTIKQRSKARFLGYSHIFLLIASIFVLLLTGNTLFPN